MIPPLPPARGPGQDGGTASIFPRYEDIAQDGRMQLTALMPGLGSAVWRELLSKLKAVRTFRSSGILPVLRRVVIVGEDRSVTVNLPVTYEGSFRLAREKGGDRLFVNMWLEARAPVGNTLAPNPPKDAPSELVGRVFAEHVLTRPFAPPAERKVTKLEGEGLPEIPEDEHVFESAEALVESAGGPLDEAGTFRFAMMHTDSNQHVNSLVYPRVFEEAAHRTLDAPRLLARAVELRWRRPFFAGETARIAMRKVTESPSQPGKIGMIGAFHGEGPKPSSALAMWFR